VLRTLRRAEYAELIALFFIQGAALGIWLVPLSTVLDANGLHAIKPFAFATSALAAFVSPLIFGAMADRHASPVKVLRGLAAATAVAMTLASTAIKFAWNPWLVLALIQLHALCSSPTWSISCTIVFARLKDAQREFGPIRAMATLGWMAGCWLVSALNADTSALAGYTGAVMWMAVAAFTFFLPVLETPKSVEHLTLRQRLGLDALTLLKNPDHRVVFITVALFAIPLAGVVTAAVGLIFGLPAARLKGLYLAIATLAAQYILLDFFARAEWFTGGSVPASAEPFSIFGYSLRGDRKYFYVVLAYVVVCYLLVTNLMRSRDGRALIAIRDHYLSAEIMGINLTKYRTLSFGLAAFFAGVGGALYAHYNQVVSNEGFGIDRSIIFLAMIIIGGLGSIMGTLMGTAFMVLLPESMEWLSVALRDSPIDQALGLKNNIAFLREMAIGVIIIIFLIFEPDGLAHRWRQIKAYWKLYPFSH
jgi:branched-chain amino acid transport system permease protein